MSETAWLFAMTMGCVAVLSALHHACNGISSSRPHCTGTCVVDSADVARADSLVSGLAAVVGANYGMNMSISGGTGGGEGARLLFAISTIGFVLVAVLLMSAPQLTYLLLIVMTVVAVVLTRYFIIGDLFLVKRFPLVLTPLLSTIAAGITLQYVLTTTDDNYAYIHSAWHLSMAVAAALVPFLFAPPPAVAAIAESKGDPFHNVVIVNNEVKRQSPAAPIAYAYVQLEKASATPTSS